MWINIERQKKKGKLVHIQIFTIKYRKLILSLLQNMCITNLTEKSKTFERNIGLFTIKYYRLNTAEFIIGTENVVILHREAIFYLLISKWNKNVNKKLYFSQTK